MKSFLVLVATLLVVVNDLSGVEPQDRVALVMGNAQYSGGIPALANAGNDARAIAERLGASGWTVILALDASRRDMVRRASEFRDVLKAHPHASALFFYAGHGVQADGKNYLLPLDEQFDTPDDLKESAFLVDRIIDILNETGVAQSVVILDACRDNPFARKSRSIGATRGLAVVPANEQAEQGSAVIFATGANEVAADGSGSHGLFTSALLDHFDEGLELVALYKKVRDQVRLASAGAQVPSIVTSGILSAMYLGSPGPGLPAPEIAIERRPTPTPTRQLSWVAPSGWALAGLGTLGAGLGSWWGVASRSNYDAATSPADAQKFKSDAVQANLLVQALAGAAAVGVVVAVVSWVAGW